MNFLSPWFLAGLAALALPWLLHRFSNEEPEVHPFPSDRFLEAVPPPVSRKRRLRHRALLALRVAALALLCLLFAGPVLDRLPGTASARDVRLFALDTSYSMRASGRFERALSALREALAALPPEQATVVVTFDDRVVALTGEGATAAEAILALGDPEPGFARADYGALMRRLDARAAASRLPMAATVLTDAQASALPLRPNELLAPRLVSLAIVRVDGEPVRVVDGSADRSVDGAVDGAGLAGNARLDARAISPDGVVARIVLTLRAGEGTSGDDPALRRRVTVAHRDETLAHLDVRIPAGGTLERVIEPVTLPSVGEPVLDIGFDAPDALPGDDGQRVPVRLIEPVAVALGAVGTRVPAAAATFLATALETDGRARVETVPTSAGVAVEGVAHAVLFVDADDAGALAEIVGIVERGTDVLAVRLPGPVPRGTPEPAPAGVAVGRVDEGHPLGLGDIDWLDVRFFAPVALEIADGDDVLVADANGAPLLVERAVRGDARLLLLDDPLDGEASDLPFAPAFVDLIGTTLDWFGASGALPERVRVGEAVALPANVQVLGPAGDDLLGLADGASASLFSPRVPGLYRVLDDRGERELVAVIDERESDLTTVSSRDVAAWAARHRMPEETGREAATDDPASRASTYAADGVADAALEAARRRHWLWLLPPVALLVLGETLVANRRLDVRRDGR